MLFLVFIAQNTLNLKNLENKTEKNWKNWSKKKIIPIAFFKNLPKILKVLSQVHRKLLHAKFQLSSL
jgi:hypothetical protein